MLGGRQDLRGAELESTRGEYVLAHNGWVMNADPLVNFANEGSQVRAPMVCGYWTSQVALVYEYNTKNFPNQISYSRCSLPVSQCASVGVYVQ